MKEAYDRTATHVSVSHILVKVDENASPEDTLAAYKKIMDIYKEAISGKNFDTLAAKYSEEPNANLSCGNIGYISAFKTIYSFECAAYNTPMGSISKPIRTKFGYHILRVNNIRPNPGLIKVAHILIFTPPNCTKEKTDSAENTIQDIYKRLLAGEDFANLAKVYSEDKGSAMYGGELMDWFGSGTMIPVFDEAAFSLKNDGDISAPIQTFYGWHIIKRLKLKKFGGYDQVKDEIKNNIAKDERSHLSKQYFLDQLKRDYGFKEEKVNLIPFYSLMDTSIYKGNWDAGKAKGLNKVLFSFAGKNYSQQDFANFISNKKVKGRNTPFKTHVELLYSEYIENALIGYEDSQLESKYPDFKYLIQEYHDGILLFNIMDEKVWSMASKDTIGLNTFYQEHRNNYMWEERIEATTFTFKDMAIAKKALPMVKKGMDFNAIKSKLYPNDSTGQQIKIDTKKYLKGENSKLDSIGWKVGVSGVYESKNSYKLENVIALLPKQPKTLNEARGIITADYQAFLEDAWIKELRNKYSIIIQRDELKNIK